MSISYLMNQASTPMKRQKSTIVLKLSSLKFLPVQYEKAATMIVLIGKAKQMIATSIASVK